MEAIIRSLIAFVVSALASVGIQASPMTWQIQPMPDGRSVNVMISTHPHSIQGETIPIDQFDGLKPLLQSDGPAKFRLKRAAGAFEFDGVLRRGAGGGTFMFVPSETFASDLAKRGFEKPTGAEQFKMAWHDTDVTLIDELAALKYQRPTLQRLIDTGDHGIDRAYVREMTSLVKDLNTVDELIRQHDHGINGVYVRELASVGLKGLTANDLVRAHDHGISSEWTRDVFTKNRGPLSLDQLVSLHDHGVRTLEDLRRRTHSS